MRSHNRALRLQRSRSWGEFRPSMKMNTDNRPNNIDNLRRHNGINTHWSRPHSMDDVELESLDQKELDEDVADPVFNFDTNDVLLASSSDESLSYPREQSMPSYGIISWLLASRHNYYTTRQFSLDTRLARFEAAVFDHLLVLCFGWQITLVLMISWLQPDAFAKHRKTDHDVIVVCWLGQCVQLLIMCLANFDAARRMSRSSMRLGALIRVYTANALTFAGLYFACYLSSPQSFRVDLNGYLHPVSVMVVFFYFSVATQGTAGFGDVVPIHANAQFLACLQMLASVLYSVAIFVVGTAHICWQRERVTHTRSRNENDFSLRFEAERGILMYVERLPGFSWWNQPVKKMPLLVTMMVLGFNLVIVYISYEDIQVALTMKVFLAGIVLITQLIQCIIVLSVSVSLVRKIESEEVTSGFLAQSYLSTVVLFAGMYFAVFLLEGVESWNLVDPALQRVLTLPGMILHFSYFSITCQTSCGIGDYYPRTNSSRILVTFHLLVAMSYTAIVLGLGMSHLVSIVPFKSSLNSSTSSLTSLNPNNRFEKRVQNTSFKFKPLPLTDDSVVL